MESQTKNLIDKYLNSGGSIKILKPKEKRSFKLVPKKVMVQSDGSRFVKRVWFMGKKFLKRLN